MKRKADLTCSIPGGRAAVRLAPGGRVLARRVQLCRGYWAKLLGLMFRRGITPEEGALLVYPASSRSLTSIHMFCVPFPLAVFWLDDDGSVVDSAQALPWRPFYAPKAAARYVLELHPSLLAYLRIGDRVEFHEPDSLP
jgi:uncharacterized membrane protein (UPF0127 family)